MGSRRAAARDRRRPARGCRPGPRRGRPLRRRAPPLRAGGAPARRARPGDPRRADQPPRRRGGGVARGAPRRPVRPALVVVTHDRWFLDAVCQQTWEVHDGVVDALRGRVRRLRARQGRAPAPGRGVRGTAPEPGPQGARLAAPRRAGPDVEAEVPHRRCERADRGRSSATRPARAAAVRGPAARQGRRRRRGRRLLPRHPRAVEARDLAPRPRRPGRAGRRQRRGQDLRAVPARR